YSTRIPSAAGGGSYDLPGVCRVGLRCSGATIAKTPRQIEPPATFTPVIPVATATSATRLTGEARSLWPLLAATTMMALVIGRDDQPNTHFPAQCLAKRRQGASDEIMVHGRQLFVLPARYGNIAPRGGSAA